MKSMIALKDHFSEVPVFVKSFLKRALIIFLCWKIVYHLILAPTRFPDLPLSILTAQSTGYLYHAMFNDVITYGNNDVGPFPKQVLYVNGEKGIAIADGCNGLELYVLYAGFILCLPTNWKRQFAFISIGVVCIYILNNFRCVGLCWMHEHGYRTDFAHHYLFKTIIYSAIFLSWVKYCRKYYFNA